MKDRSILARLESQGRDAPRVELKGTEFGKSDERYELVGEIARGGVGEVWKGRDTDLGREVAIKLLRGDLATQHRRCCPESCIVEEAQVGGQLQHPGIVPVYSLGLKDDRPYFAMKLVKGKTFAAALKEGADRQRMLARFARVCETVAFAHARGVVHRDLKPGNLMIGAYGEVLVLDWGFAKVLQRGGVADERPAKDVTKVATVRSHGEGSASVAGVRHGYARVHAAGAGARARR